MTGSIVRASQPAFPIADKGAEFPVNYAKYGTFSGVGTSEYKYKINDRAGLSKAMGAGLYPSSDMSKDPGFVKWIKKNKTDNHWERVNTGDTQGDFYTWTQAKGIGPGTKLFFTADALEQAGHFQQAAKAYYAVVVLFPSEPCWSADQSFVWYLGPTALSRIESITKHHPEIGWRLKGAVCKVENDKDTDLKNDVVTVDPGQWVKRAATESVSKDAYEIVERRGLGKVQVVQYKNKHWELLVDEEPFFVKGVTYLPTTIGQHVEGDGNSWMWDDENENGQVDLAYETWLDANKNNKREAAEKAVGDFQLLKNMGANTIRLYRNSQDLEYDAKEFNKELLREMHKKYGIHVIMGDFLGAYTVGSGANWDEGTDYTDPVQLENMRLLIKAYVIDHREEPYVLMWLLGNENLMPGEYDGVNATRTKAGTQVEAYLKFVNEMAQMIHRLDADHPVAVGNLDLTQLEAHAKYAPDVDIFGANSYKGASGFGDMWKKIQNTYDRAVLITEFGCDAYDSRKGKEDEDAQAKYHEGVWKDISLNRARGGEEGNAIGGVVFEFVDEWWKSNQGSWSTHEKTNDSPMAFPDGWSSEEWLGVMSQGNGKSSPLMRQARKAYLLYKDKLWK